MNIIVPESSDNSTSNNIIKSNDVIRRVDRNTGILSEVQVGSDRVAHNRVYNVMTVSLTPTRAMLITAIGLT